ncbi:unnamed protein product [Moneuplotes crassus]|uniref:DHHA2 domain-containing protein n=1 Tax=Euplotes crassus TaxID=5936 RepID=A0AAD1UQB6_EUPCR|nr:unnamed protein product [Moneuplotes crassus]
MEKFTRYLKDAWALTQALYAPKKASFINVSLGNVSGDMDSVVCSIVLGYYLTYKQGFYEEVKDEIDPENLSEEQQKKFFVPVLNMNKEDIVARSDIIHHFELNGINYMEIPAYDEIDLRHYAEQGTLRANLVDHNFPDCNQEYLVEHVERIYDHHFEKPAEYPNMVFKDIRFCGSAATLVANAMLNDEELKSELLDHQVAWFASAPILIDTVNFKEKQRGKKWDQIDEDVYKLVKEIAGDTIPEDYFRTLYLKKTDVQTNINLGFRLLARKDYKNYKINDELLGISTIFLDINICDNEFGAENLVKEFDDIMKERNLSMYMVLTHYEEDHDVRRQILAYSHNTELVEKLKDLFSNGEDFSTEPLTENKLNDIENCYVWQNNYTSQSRKKIEPLIRKHFAVE